MNVADRLGGIAIMAQNMKRLDPANFAREPISGFIDALTKDIEKVADEWLEEEDE